jgi:hypothetical protein
VKVKLREVYGFAREDGTRQNFFGVPFTCKNKDLPGGKFLSEWFADVDVKLAKELDEAGRVEIIKKAKED